MLKLLKQNLNQNKLKQKGRNIKTTKKLQKHIKCQILKLNWKPKI